MQVVYNCLPPQDRGDRVPLRTAFSHNHPAVARVVSNLHFTVIAPLPTIRCDCALRSFEIAEPFLLFGAESLVDF
jgi:hypothetical protein